MDDTASPSLRERKQRRTRKAIIDAAMALFGEQGFDGVTVSDIAARAEVGRTTFFRYFDDKQELLFAEESELLHALTEATDRAARDVAPIGDSLEAALGVARAGLLALTGAIVRYAAWLPLRERLIREYPALAARNLVKERRYVQAMVQRLVGHGATPETATLAAGVAAACYWTAQAATTDDPARLPEAVDAAFRRLAGLDRAALAARLG